MFTAALEARLFGLVAHSPQRAEGVETVTLVRSREPGSSSQTPDRLVFQTTHGAVDLGRNQQLFAPDYTAIREFLEQDGPESMTLSSIHRDASAGASWPRRRSPSSCCWVGSASAGGPCAAWSGETRRSRTTGAAAAP